MTSMMADQGPEALFGHELYYDASPAAITDDANRVD